MFTNSSSTSRELDVRGFLGLDETVRPGFQHIQVKCSLEADTSDEEIRKLVDIAQKRSPVFDSIAHGVPVTVEIVPIEKEQTA